MKVYVSLTSYRWWSWIGVTLCVAILQGPIIIHECYHASSIALPPIGVNLSCLLRQIPVAGCKYAPFILGAMRGGMIAISDKTMACLCSLAHGESHEYSNRYFVSRLVD